MSDWDSDTDSFMTSDTDLFIDSDGILSESSGDAMIYNNNYVNESRVNEIYMLETDYIELDKIHNTCYIGYYWYVDYKHILDVIIQPSTFLLYNYYEIASYLSEMSIFTMPYRRKSKIHIMKLYIQNDGTYMVVIKTYWLRIIQRRWRTICKERKQIIQKRKQLSTMRTIELTGKIPYFPGLRDIFIPIQKK